jgi:hypothetical protein
MQPKVTFRTLLRSTSKVQDRKKPAIKERQTPAWLLMTTHPRQRPRVPLSNQAADERSAVPMCLRKLLRLLQHQSQQADGSHHNVVFARSRTCNQAAGVEGTVMTTMMMTRTRTATRTSLLAARSQVLLFRTPDKEIRKTIFPTS